MKTLLYAVCILVVLFTFQVAVQVPSVAASPAVYIRPDGRVDPPTVPIQVIGNVYTFTNNVYDIIVIQKSNIVINGAGYVLESPSEYSRIQNGNGLDLSECSNITVENLEISNFYRGIILESSSGNTFSNNRFTSNSIALDVREGSTNTIIDNTFSANGYAISFSGGINNVLSGNIMNDNSASFKIFGSKLSDFQQSIDTSNLVDGKPVYFLKNQANIEINPVTHPQVGFLALINCNDILVEGIEVAKNEPSLALVNCNNVTIRNVALPNDQPTILVSYTDNSIITNNNLLDTRGAHCIRLLNSSHNIVSNNQIISSFSLYSAYSHGIGISDGFNNTVFQNLVVGTGSAICLLNSNENIIQNNSITNTTTGIKLEGSSGNIVTGNTVFHTIKEYLRYSEFGTGISIDTDAINNQFYENNITTNKVGVSLSSSPNTFARNTIADNELGLSIEAANNKIYNNNFLNNTKQAEIASSSVALWDNGTAGNYWSDYLTRYPNASEINDSGIGDTPYVIDANNTDNYPLMAPYETSPTESKPETKPFPTVLVVAVTVAVVAVIAVGILVYFKKGND
jgi:parallel beta-helix repeat protein